MIHSNAIGLETARKVVNEARREHGDADRFDYYIAVNGLEPFGPLYNQVYILANEVPPMPDLSDERARLSPEEFESLIERRAQERKRRASDLWNSLAPHLERYASECRKARFTGWSTMSNGPVRLVGAIPGFPREG